MNYGVNHSNGPVANTWEVVLDQEFPGIDDFVPTGLYQDLKDNNGIVANGENPAVAGIPGGDMTMDITEDQIFEVMSSGVESIDEVEAALNIGTQNSIDIFDLYNP